VAAGAVLTGAITGPSYSATADQSPFTVSHFYAEGPSTSCDLDVCGIGGVKPVRVALPAGPARYDVLATVSLQYKTSDRGRFQIAADVVAPHGHRIDMQPTDRGLGASPHWQSVTLLYRAPNLAAGRTYRFSLSAGVRKYAGQRHVHIATSRVVVAVSGSPSQ
jgi:hypothetical protein